MIKSEPQKDIRGWDCKKYTRSGVGSCHRELGALGARSRENRRPRISRKGTFQVNSDFRNDVKAASIKRETRNKKNSKLVTKIFGI